MRTILVPVDFTLRSRQAVRYAQSIARASGAELVLLHVLPAPGTMHLAVDAYLGLPIPRTSLELQLATEHRLARFAAALVESSGSSRCLVESGSPAATIVRVASELAADLVVIGTRAHRGVAGLVLGSVAHEVMTCAPCPVVTLRGDEVRADV
jgi:nucleotide-binding universal stress UspA family protein